MLCNSRESHNKWLSSAMAQALEDKAEENIIKEDDKERRKQESEARHRERKKEKEFKASLKNKKKRQKRVRKV